MVAKNMPIDLAFKIKAPASPQNLANDRCGVKNGPDALKTGCLYYPRKQTSVSYAAGCDVIACYGNAKPTDKHLASKIHCVDDELIGWLERRERRHDQAARQAMDQGKGAGLAARRARAHGCDR
jgi:hypothetical protein